MDATTEEVEEAAQGLTNRVIFPVIEEDTWRDICFRFYYIPVLGGGFGWRPGDVEDLNLGEVTDLLEKLVEEVDRERRAIFGTK